MQILPSIDALREIPFFNADAWHPSRDIATLNFFVDGKWHCWVPMPHGLQRMHMWPAESNYFGDRPERPTDQYFRLFDFTAQRASFHDVRLAVRGIWSDFQNLATSLAKLQFFFGTAKDKLEARRFAETEVEYMVLVCRGVFDLLQESVAAHWKRTTIVGAMKKRNLPKSFADVLFRSNTPQTADEISRRYGLPKPLADLYVHFAAFFSWLRDLRNVIAHRGGTSVDLLFVTHRGFAIRRGERPWCSLHDWPKDCELPNELVPLRPVLCAMVKNVVNACDTFASVLQSSIQFPAEIFPGLRYYSRGHCDTQFSQLDAVVHGSLWCDTQPSDAPTTDNLWHPQA